MAPRVTCECGECRKCKHREYMRRYYADNAEKVRETASRSRSRRLESVREYDRQRGFRSYDKAKERARRILNHAVAAGRVARGSCEKCGTTENVEGHHDDYSLPLDVRWLCRTHHAEIHRRIGAF